MVCDRSAVRMVLSDETAKANAMLAGMGRTRRVLLGDTLLASFTLDEIEQIIDLCDSDRRRRSMYLWSVRQE